MRQIGKLRVEERRQKRHPGSHGRPPSTLNSEAKVDRGPDYLRRERLPCQLSVARAIPLVVSPKISHARVHCVIVDGGSSFSITTTKVLDLMQIPHFEIKKISKSFCEIISGMAHEPAG